MITNSTVDFIFSNKLIIALYFFKTVNVRFFVLTFDTLTADVEAVLAADFKDDALLGFAVQAGIPAVSLFVRW